MGYAEKIGNPGATPTVADLEKARLARQIEAEKLTLETPTFAQVLGDRLALWVRDGGPKPWEQPDAAASPQTYPPIVEHRSQL